VLKFLKAWDRAAFERKVAAASFLTESDTAEINDKIKTQGMTLGGDWPELSRDTGAEILQMIADRPEGIKLGNALSFAGDSLMCEWAYVIDLDSGKLEVLKGFNKTPLAEGDRFFGVPGLEISGGYHPVRKVASYDLDSLPTVEQMERDCDPEEEETK